MPKVKHAGSLTHQRSSNQAAYNLLRSLLDRQGMTLDDLIEGLALQGYTYTKEAIRNWGKAAPAEPAANPPLLKEGRRGFPRHAGLIPAIVRVLVEHRPYPAGLPLSKAVCTTYDAVQFAILSEMPLAELAQLASLFPVEDFSSALVDQLARFAIPLRVAPAPGLENSILRTADALLTDLPVDWLPRSKPVPVFPALSYSKDFVGRQAELRTIATRLKRRAQRLPHPPPTLIITGAPGLGKSELARQFVAHYGQFFRGGVFWLSCATPASIPSLIAACSVDRMLDLPPTVQNLPTESQVHLVQAAWHSPLPRLLIFDNCEDEDVLQHWRPASGGCWVLVTSRRALWSDFLEVETLPLDVLDRDSAIQLLQSQDATLPLPDLHAIAAELGDLPLALHLAASALAQGDPATSAAQYLHALRSTPLVTDQGLDDATAHTQLVAKSCEVSYVRLQSRNATDAIALDLLRCMVAFAPGEPVPRGLLLDAVLRLNRHHELPLLGEQAVRRLLDLGLVEPSGQDAVRTHRLILSYLAQQHDSSAQRAAYDVVAQALIALVQKLNERGHTTLSLPLQPHLRWLIHTAGHAPTETIASLHELLGHLLYLCDDNLAAHALLQQAVAMRQQIHGADDLRTSDAMYLLALIEQAAGNLAQAQTIMYACLAIRTAQAGPNAGITARTLNSLGHLMQQQGFYGQAHSAFVAAIHIYRFEQATYPAQYGRCLRNLAMLCLRRGYVRLAERMGRQGLALLQATLPPNHIAVAQATNHLGEIVFARGAFAAAWDLHTQALIMRRAWFGTDASLGVAESFYNLGRVLLAQHHYGDAATYLKQALATLATINQRWNMPACMLHERLGCAELLLGNLDGATAQWRQALAISDRLADRQHPQAVAITDHLGVLAMLQEDWQTATNSIQQALHLREQSLGSHHPAFAQSLVHLAQLKDHAGDHAHACCLLAQAKRIYHRRLGPHHPLTRSIEAMCDCCTHGKPWLHLVLHALSYD